MTELFRQPTRPGTHPDTTGLWVRRAVMTLLVVVAALALANAFGQRTSTSRGAGPAARVSVNAPARVRGGLLFQSRVEVRALSDIGHPRLVLARGWLEGMQVNSIEPQPVGQQSRGHDLVLSYDALKAGEHMTVWLQFQVDPTATGRRPYDLELDDAEQPLARVRRTITVLP